MRNQIRVTGIVLSVFPIGENDRRVTILTKERGKLAAFAKGSRKPNHPLFGATQPLVMGEFMVTEGRTAAYLNSAEAKDHFPILRSDLEMIYYGTYFAELAEYFTVEGMDESNILNLLFVTLKAMEKQKLPLPLIRRIYEYRILQYYGIGLQVSRCFSCGKEEAFTRLSVEHGGVVCEDCARKLKSQLTGLTRLSPAVLYALRYVSFTPLTSLYGFLLKDEIFAEFSWIIKHFMRLHVNHRFRSAQMLDSL